MSCSYDSDAEQYLDQYGDPCTPDENQNWGGGGGGYTGSAMCRDAQNNIVDCSQIQGGSGNPRTGNGNPVLTQIYPYPITGGASTLDKILASTLSSLALLTHQNQVPTTQAPGLQYSQYKAPIYGPGQLPLSNTINPTSGNLLGQIQTSFQKNTSLWLLGIGAFALYKMDSTKRR